MDKKEQILHYYRIEGLSLREISRRVGLNRKTVTRYVQEYEDVTKQDSEEGIDLCLAQKPTYPSRKTECTKLTEDVTREIEFWLQENARRRQTGMRKQCLKRQDIHRALIEKGFDIVYNHVSAGKAYRLINDFSHSIGNGDLLTSKSEYKSLFRMSTVSHINLAKDRSAFALAINETLTDLDTILQQYNLSEAA